MRRLQAAHVAFWLALTVVLTVLNFMLPFSWYAQFFTDVGIPAAFFGSVLFLVYYTLLSAWWGNPMGRMLWWLDLSIAAILFSSVLQNQFHVKLSVEMNYRVQLAGVLISAIVVISRLILLGYLNGWTPHWPWTHRQRARDHAAEGMGAEVPARGQTSEGNGEPEPG